MAYLFLFLFFIALISLIIGLIKPSIFTLIIKRELTRKQVALFFGLATVLFFILIGVPAEQQDPALTPEPATENDLMETATPTNDETDIKELEPETTNQVKKEPESKVTLGEKNALRKAKEYLNYTAFSHSGLIAQLEYEGFTRQQAEYGAKSVGY